eukprot:3146454-Rhodomonas_salina.1
MMAHESHRILAISSVRVGLTCKCNVKGVEGFQHPRAHIPGSTTRLISAGHLMSKGCGAVYLEEEVEARRSPILPYITQCGRTYQ